MTGTYRIVVGVDGSEGGRRALRWAVQQAGYRSGTVQAIAAWSWDGLDLPPRAATRPEEEHQRATELLDREIESLGPTDVVVASEAVEGLPGEVLTSAARDADLLVLGSHGHGRLRRSVLGSVTDACVRKATCPVVVLPVPHPVVQTSAEPALRQ
jgi:nucleotide-binding universal stress UspA family protein